MLHVLLITGWRSLLRRAGCWSRYRLEILRREVEETQGRRSPARTPGAHDELSLRRICRYLDHPPSHIWGILVLRYQRLKVEIEELEK